MIHGFNKSNFGVFHVTRRNRRAICAIAYFFTGNHSNLYYERSSHTCVVMQTVQDHLQMLVRCKGFLSCLQIRMDKLACGGIGYCIVEVLLKATSDE